MKADGTPDTSLDMSWSKVTWNTPIWDVDTGARWLLPVKYRAYESLGSPIGKTISVWCLALASSAGSSAQTSLAMLNAAQAFGQPA